VVDREQGGGAALAGESVRLYPLFRASEIVDAVARPVTAGP
jgi:hypothetical protein